MIRRRPRPGRRPLPPGGRQLLGLDPRRDRPHGRGPRAEPAGRGRGRPVHRATAPRAVRSGARRRSRWRTRPPRARGSRRWRCRRTRPAPWPGTSATASASSRHGSRCIEGDPATAADLADWVRDDATRRGAPRAAVQAEVVEHLAAADDRAVDDAAVDATIAAPRRPRPARGLALTARLAAATGRADLWPEPSATPSSSRPPAAPTPTASAPGPRAPRAPTSAKQKRRDSGAVLHRRVTGR